MNKKMLTSVISVSAFATAVATGHALASTSDYHNGSYGEGSFENGWQDDLGYAWDEADRFRAQVNNNTSTRFGTFNLHGSAQPGRWHDSCDGCSSGGLDTADIVFAGTHGGALGDSSSDPYAVWTMGDENAFADSRDMELGEEDDYLQIFAVKSCDTMSLTQPDSSKMWKRWDSIMKGGLYVALASHDTMYFGYWERKGGEAFAEELQSGATVRYAWKDGMARWDNNQDVMALFAANSSSNCSSRRSGLTWSNTTSYTRYRGSSASHWCSSSWDNV